LFLWKLLHELKEIVFEKKMTGRPKDKIPVISRLVILFLIDGGILITWDLWPAFSFQHGPS
jgi:hypothetical protein